MNGFLSFRITRQWGVILSLLFAFASQEAAAGLDHRVSQNTGGIYQYYNAPSTILLVTSLGGALWLGSEDRLGRTFWQSSEALLVSHVTTQVLKHATGRLRPYETDDPNQWRQGGSSFPSDHVASVAALVTPLILEYRAEHPAVWALAVLPAYEMVARVRKGVHWQSDVIVGAALGAAIGYAAHARGP